MNSRMRHVQARHTLVEGKKEWVDVVRHGLEEAVDGMEGMAGKGRGDLPLVVQLVQRCVEHRVVQPAVDPVDAEILGDEWRSGV